MSVAPSPISQPRNYRTRSRTTQKLAQKSLAHQNSKSQVEKLSTRSKSIPASLRSLLILQKTSSVVVFILMAAALSIYAWIVYSQQLWSKEYKKLETLQRDERQLTSTNETIKNQAAKEAEKQEFGLVPLTPDKNIFVPATVDSTAKKVNKIETQKEESLESTPLAY